MKSFIHKTKIYCDKYSRLLSEFVLLPGVWFSFYGHVKLAFMRKCPMFLSIWTIWFSPNCGEYFPYPVTSMQFNRLLIAPFLEYKRIIIQQKF